MPTPTVTDLRPDQPADRWDIGPVRGLDIVGMPKLAHHVDAHPGALDDVLVLYSNHAISDALMVARGLRRVGAQLTSVLIPYHGADGPTQHAVLAWVPCARPDVPPGAGRAGRLRRPDAGHPARGPCCRSPARPNSRTGPAVSAAAIAVGGSCMARSCRFLPSRRARRFGFGPGNGSLTCVHHDRYGESAATADGGFLRSRRRPGRGW